MGFYGKIWRSRRQHCICCYCFSVLLVHVDGNVTGKESKMIKLETLRYLLSLKGSEKYRVWKKSKNVFIYIDNWTTPKYHLLSTLRYNGYTCTETSENLVYQITKWLGLWQCAKVEQLGVLKCVFLCQNKLKKEEF